MDADSEPDNGAGLTILPLCKYTAVKLTRC
jgi:hypothetical protein